MYLLGLRLAELRGTLAPERIAELVGELKRLPHCIDELIDDCETRIDAIAETCWNAEFFLYIGRHVGLAGRAGGSAEAEGDLLHRDRRLRRRRDEARPDRAARRGHAGRLRRDRSPVLEKLVSNIQEVRARGAHVIAVTTAGEDVVEPHADATIAVPATDWMLQPILAVIPLQLLAYRDRAPARPERRPAAQPGQDGHRRVARRRSRACAASRRPVERGRGRPSSIAVREPAAALARPAARRRDDARRRPLGDRGARGGRPRSDGARRRGRGAGGRAPGAGRPGDGGVRQGQQRRRRAGGGAPAARLRAAGDGGVRGAAGRARGRRAREPRASAGRRAGAAERGGVDAAAERAGEPRPRRSRTVRPGRVVVDALLGTGFQGEPRGAVAEAIDAINAARRAGRERGRAERRRRLDGSRLRRGGARVGHRHLPRGQAGAVDQPGQGARGRGADDRHRHPARRSRRRVGRPDRAERARASCRAGQASSTKFTSGHVLVARRLARADRRAEDGRRGEHARGRRLRHGVRARLAAGDPRRRRHARR